MINNMEINEMFRGTDTVNGLDKPYEFTKEHQIITTALRLLASCAYGMNASGDMSKKASVNMTTGALALANEYDIDFGTPEDQLYKDLQRVEQWFNNYKCPKCGYDKEDRMSQII